MSGEQRRPEGRSSLREVALVFLVLGTVAFGGPAAHVSLMRRIIVRRLRWIDEDQFFELFAACNLIPGPSSTELAILLGYKQAGKRGLILAGTCFILPAMAIMMTLAFLYKRYGDSITARHVLLGVTVTVVGILGWAVQDMGRRLVHDVSSACLTLGVAIGILVYANPIVFLAAGGILFLLRAKIPATTPRQRASGVALVPAISLSSLLKAKLAVLFGTFLKLGFIAFGSGYVLLVFLRTDFVLSLHWLSERQVVDAIAISQATPGPVFTTATFIGYLVGGIPGGALSTLAIFAPGFILIPPLERFVRFVQKHVALREALRGVNLAALGLIAGVSFEVARTVIISPAGVVVAAASFLILVRQPLAAPVVVVAGALIGLGVPNALTMSLGL